MPASLRRYADVNMGYEVMPGWTEDISKARRFEDLPINCQKYVLRLEEVCFCFDFDHFDKYINLLLCTYRSVDWSSNPLDRSWTGPRSGHRERWFQVAYSMLIRPGRLLLVGLKAESIFPQQNYFP